MKRIIAIAGHACSGKDRLYTALENYYATAGLKTQRFAFADELKHEVDDFLKQKVGISAWTSDPVEKKIIRPFLVFWGTEFRRAQNPDHWINCMKGSKAWNESTADLIVITDLRFSNEYEWIKREGGTCIYLSRLSKAGIPLEPPNNYEAVNNSWLRDHTDIDFIWPTFDTQEELEKFTNSKLITKL